MKASTKYIAILFAVLFHLNLFSQQPKAVVIITLDQFPYYYIQRFQPYFSVDGGFNYLIQHGANFENVKFEHALTKTAPGHAAISTGTYANINGIISNGWYDRDKKKYINSVSDDSGHIIGNNQGGKSPKNLLIYTLGDMLRIHSNFRSKVIAISNKDRSAILMAGKLGTAYWIAESLIVTSTYYMQSLPSYVKAINTSGLIRDYFGKTWNEINPSIAAILCDEDNVPYEADWGKIGKAFPHHIYGDNSSSITPSYYQSLELSPHSTEFLLNAACSVFTAESLGLRGITDMLFVGISVTDEIGHAYGPDSRETFDNILRTDKMLGDFFSFIDNKIGLSNCIIALTSDHGVAHIPEFLKKKSPDVQAGRVSSKMMAIYAKRILENKFGQTERESCIEYVNECDIYFNHDILFKNGITLEAASQVLKDSFMVLPFIAEVVTRPVLEVKNIQNPVAVKVKKSFHSHRSGDVLYVLKPNFIMSGDSVGTNHGQPYDYDSHVPLVFYGKMFLTGTYKIPAQPIDLAPTIAAALEIECPQPCEGRVLKEALRLFEDPKNR
ncbi:MAG: alkaline phosphatase family protein [Bacteroidota bacterium]|nr:alkaline phosphatase family protein [Bacteroidota bacterium]